MPLKPLNTMGGGGGLRYCSQQKKREELIKAQTIDRQAEREGGGGGTCIIYTFRVYTPTIEYSGDSFYHRVFYTSSKSTIS